MIPYQLAILIGIGAFVFSYILTEPGAILNKPYMWLYDFFKTDNRLANGKSVHWLFMILMYCEKCVAGQWAFWIFMYRKLPIYIHNFSIWLFITHILFTLFTIFIAAIVKQLYTKIQHT